jgi:hypothetical protein
MMMITTRIRVHLRLRTFKGQIRVRSAHTAIPAKIIANYCKRKCGKKVSVFDRGQSKTTWQFDFAKNNLITGSQLWPLSQWQET